MCIKKMLSSSVFHSCAMTLFTFLLVITSILNWIMINKQTKISSKLEDIQNYYLEKGKSNAKTHEISERKKLKIVIENILNLFSWQGIDERLEHTKYQNQDLAIQFNNFLVEGLDNHILVNNEEALARWLKAMNTLTIYTFREDDQIMTHALSNEEFNKMFIKNITSAWQNVFWTYIHLDLTPSAMYEKFKKDTISISNE